MSAPREPESSERGVNIKHDFGAKCGNDIRISAWPF
jgi:hypothetical protein